MNEYTKKKLVIAAGVVWLLICVGLVIAGHTIGTFGTLSQGLAGLGVELLAWRAFWFCCIFTTNRTQSN